MLQAANAANPGGRASSRRADLQTPAAAKPQPPTAAVPPASKGAAKQVGTPGAQVLGDAVTAQAADNAASGPECRLVGAKRRKSSIRSRSHPGLTSERPMQAQQQQQQAQQQRQQQPLAVSGSPDSQGSGSKRDSSHLRGDGSSIRAAAEAAAQASPFAVAQRAAQVDSAARQSVSSVK